MGSTNEGTVNKETAGNDEAAGTAESVVTAGSIHPPENSKSHITYSKPVIISDSIVLHMSDIQPAVAELSLSQPAVSEQAVESHGNIAINIISASSNSEELVPALMEIHQVVTGTQQQNSEYLDGGVGPEVIQPSTSYMESGRYPHVQNLRVPTGLYSASSICSVSSYGPATPHQNVSAELTSSSTTVEYVSTTTAISKQPPQRVMAGFDDTQIQFSDTAVTQNWN